MASAEAPQKAAKSTQPLVIMVRLLEVQPQQRRMREVRTMTATITELRQFQLCYKALEITLTILEWVNGMVATTASTTELHFTPKLKEKHNLQCYFKAKIIEVLVTRNNLTIKNARGTVKRKDILHVSVRRKTNKHRHHLRSQRLRSP